MIESAYSYVGDRYTEAEEGLGKRKGVEVRCE